MSYELINDDEKEKYQELFEKILKHNTKDLGVRKIPDPGGYREEPIHWSLKHNYWYLTTERGYNRLKKCWIKNNYWTNAFGLEKPKGKTAKVICEINFSIKDWNAEGLLVRDIVTQTICVAHKGGLRINEELNEEKEKFTRKKVNIEFKNPINYIDKKGNEREAELVCELSEDEKKYLNIQNEVKEFIERAREKKEASNKNNNPPPQKNTENLKGKKIEKGNEKKENIKKTNAILIKNPKITGQNDYAPDSPNLTPPEDKLEVINRAFRLILPVLSKYIGKILKEKDNNWWRKYVLGKLKDENTKRKLPKEGSDNEFIESLDIPACINIIECNWADVFKDKMDDRQRTWAHALYDIRNYYEAHYNTKTLTTSSVEDISLELAIMIRFMRPIDSDVAGQISEMRKAFENKFKNE